MARFILLNPAAKSDFLSVSSWQEITSGQGYSVILRKISYLNRSSYEDNAEKVTLYVYQAELADVSETLKRRFLLLRFRLTKQVGFTLFLTQ